MARRKKKPDIRGPLQRIIDAANVANDQSVIDVITPEQKAKGTYQGERRIVNNHDPVARWMASTPPKLSESQQLAIGYVRRLWEIAGLKQRVTANYGQTIVGAASAELRAHVEIEARKDLHRCQEYVPECYWAVFEQVCRWGEPAGVAGSTMGFGGRSAKDRAHTIVCFVADTIAMKERL